jgi:hypothetical protein
MLNLYERETLLCFPAGVKYFSRDLRSFGISRSLEWQFLTDVSGQPRGSYLYDLAAQELTLENGTP